MADLDMDKEHIDVLQKRLREMMWIRELMKEKKTIYIILDFIKMSFDKGFDLTTDAVWIGIQSLLKEYAVCPVG